MQQGTNCCKECYYFMPTMTADESGVPQIKPGFTSFGIDICTDNACECHIKLCAEKEDKENLTP